MDGIPAITVTSDHLAEVVKEVTHSAEDRPEVVDFEKLVELASAPRELNCQLTATGSSRFQR